MPVIQIASVTGIYGISFLLVWSALCLLSAGMVILRRPVKRSAWAGEIILPMLAVTALFVGGYEKLLRPGQKEPVVTVALIQPSIPQSMIWNAEEDEHRFEQLLQLSEEATKGKPDVIIWPEAALPRMLRYDRDIYDATTGLARTHKVWMIVGSDDKELASE